MQYPPGNYSFIDLLIHFWGILQTKVVEISYIPESLWYFKNILPNYLEVLGELIFNLLRNSSCMAIPLVDSARCNSQTDYSLCLPTSRGKLKTRKLR